MRRRLWFIVIWNPRKRCFSTYTYKKSVRVKVILSVEINKGARVIANRSKDVQYIFARNLTSKKISNEDARMHWASRRPKPNWVLLTPFSRKHRLHSNRTLTKMQIIKKVVHCQKKARRVLMVTTCQKNIENTKTLATQSEVWYIMNAILPIRLHGRQEGTVSTSRPNRQRRWMLWNILINFFDQPL